MSAHRFLFYLDSRIIPYPGELTHDVWDPLETPVFSVHSNDNSELRSGATTPRSEVTSAKYLYYWQRIKFYTQVHKKKKNVRSDDAYNIVKTECTSVMRFFTDQIFSRNLRSFCSGSRSTGINDKNWSVNIGLERKRSVRWDKRDFFTVFF